MSTIKLSCGELTVKHFNSNIEAVFEGETTSYCFDVAIDFTTEENISDFIEMNLKNSLQMDITPEDEKKLQEELKVYFYPHSKECFE